MKKIISILLLSVFLAGCALWTKVETSQVAADDNSFTVDLPVGWMRAGFVRDGIRITRDGMGLENIGIAKYAYDKAFKKIEKKITDGMLPSEISELAIAEIKTVSGLTNLVVVDNKPVTIEGSPGFRLHLNFKTERGLQYERVIYGFTHDKALYVMDYQAPSLHYFPQHIKTFERVVDSFRLKTDKTQKT